MIVHLTALVLWSVAVYAFTLDQRSSTVRIGSGLLGSLALLALLNCLQEWNGGSGWSEFSLTAAASALSGSFLIHFSARWTRRSRVYRPFARQVLLYAIPLSLGLLPVAGYLVGDSAGAWVSRIGYLGVAAWMAAAAVLTAVFGFSYRQANRRCSLPECYRGLTWALALVGGGLTLSIPAFANGLPSEGSQPWHDLSYWMISGGGLLFGVILTREKSRFLTPATAGLPVFNAVREALWITGGNGFIHSANRSLCELSGRSRRELVGMRAQDLIAPGEERTQWFAELDRIREDGTIPERPLNLLTRDGTLRPILLSASLVRKGNGGFWGILYTAQDISVRMRYSSEIDQSRARLAAVLEGSADPVWTIGGDGRIQSINAAGQELFQRDGNPPVQSGQRIEEILAETVRAEVMSAVDSALEGFKTDRELSWDQGEQASLLEMNFHPVPGAHGNPDGVLVFCRDITRRKKAEDALRESEARARRLAMVASRTTNGVIITDAGGRIEWVNDGFTRMSGYSLGEVLGHSPGEILQGEETDMETVRRMHQAIRRKEGFSEEVLNYTRGGEQYWIRIDAQPLFSDEGDFTGYMAIQSDITDRRAAEARLRRAIERAEEATRAKSDFLANMSHEIRTPMNVVIGMTNLLADSDLREEQKEYVELIQSSGETLLNIINQVLDLSKIESGRIELEELDFDLPGFLEETTELFAPRCQEKGIEIALDLDPSLPSRVRGDMNRFRQILSNLLSNAVKFTERGSVRILTRCLAESTPDIPVVEISVADTGIGIPPEKHASLFQSFTQIDSSISRKYGGTGLGLAICQRLVGLLGGRISLDSVAGVGSTFRVVVPLIRPGLAEDVDDGDSYSAAGHAGETLLLYHPAPEIRVIQRRKAESLGLRVVEVTGCPGEGYPANVLDSVGRFRRSCLALINYPSGDASLEAIPPTLRAWIEEKDPPGLMHCLPFGQRREEPGFPSGTVLFRPLRRESLPRALAEAVALRGRAEKEKVSAPTGQSSLTVRDRSNGQQPTANGYRSDFASGSLRILIAEDNPGNRMVMTTLLNRAGYQATLVRNGREAIDILRREPFDLIFMDLAMPEMDGLTATEIIRQEWGDQSPWIVAVTANVMPEDRQRCLDAGMDDFLSKPVRSPEVHASIETFRRGGPSDPESLASRFNLQPSRSGR